jgi:hypothetical protein
MMKKLILLTLILGNISFQVNAQWKLLGPWGGQVNCILSTDSFIFAGTDGGGIYRSSNQGMNWIPVNVGIPGWCLYINTLVAIGKSIVAGTHQGAFISTNNGDSWSL